MDATRVTSRGAGGAMKAGRARTGAANRPITARICAQNRLSRLDPARRSAVEDRLSQIPKSARLTYLRAVGGRSPKSAIKAFCLECVGWQRADVRRCTALACPLYAYRPYQES